MAPSAANYKRRSRNWLAAAPLAALAAVAVSLGGCAVDDIAVISYTSSAEVKPPENRNVAAVGSSPFPWDVVLRGVSDILTGARKKAMEEKVGYRESRSFHLLRLKRAEGAKEGCRSDNDTVPEQCAGESER